MFFLHNWTSPVSKLVRFFITARALFGTSPFSSQLDASCFEHVSLLFNWTHRVSNKSFFLRNWAPVSKTFHFFVTARALARTIPFSSQLTASCFEQVSFGRNSMHPAGTLFVSCATPANQRPDRMIRHRRSPHVVH